MTFDEKELEDYNEYLNFIREEISIECRTKFTTTGYEPTPDEINIISLQNRDDDGRWRIIYSVYYPHPVMNIIKKIPEKKNKVSGMSKKPGYPEWRAIKIANEREEKLRQLGI